MSGRIFDVDDSPPTPPVGEPPRRSPRTPRNRKPFIFALAAVVILGLVAAGVLAIWSLRKRIQAVVSSLPSPIPAASPANVPKTKFENFRLKYGTVTIKGYSVIGSISGTGGTLTTQAVQLTDATTKETAEAVVFVLKQNVGYLKNQSSSVIDYDEVDSLLRGLDFVSKVDAGVTPLQSFEAVYRSHGGFQIGAYNDDKGKVNAVLVSGEITVVSIYVKLEDLAMFRGQVVAAKGKLDQVRPAAK